MGVARWLSTYSNTFTFQGTACGHSVSDSGTEFAWGAGGQVRIGNFGARLEYEAFKISGTNGANVVSLTAFVNLF